MDINRNYFQSNDLLSSNPYNEMIKSSLKKDNCVTTSKNRFVPPVERTHIAIINSSNRLIENESMWNFRVKMNPCNSTLIKSPVYENNPTLKQTETQKKMGILGNWNSSYDPNEPKGNIIAFDYIIFQGEKGCKIKQHYKNIIEFNIEHVEIPLRVLNYYNISLQTVLLEISELSGFNNIQTTSNIDTNTSFVLINSKGASNTSVIFSSLESIKFFVPTNQLSSLTLHTKIPFITENENIDIIEINKLVYSNTNKNISINTIDDIQSIFEVGDALSFDSTTFSDVSNLSPSELNYLNTIISDQIHYIKSISSKTITLTTDLDYINTNFEILPDTSRQISGSITTEIKPKVLNLSLQTQYIIKIKTAENV